MLAITIDGRAYTGQPGQTVLEIAQGAGVFIPSLCFDGRVAASGACGLCLVELEGASRPVRACATVIAPGMAVRTDAPPIRAAQKRILELLLSTHAGDCVAPCRAACPAETDCAGYIKHIAQGEWEEAAALLYEAHPFPASVARICPRPCEKKCRRANQEEAVNIAALKQYGIDVLGQSGGRPFPADAPFAAPAHRVAILGGGPAGLTAGYFLRRAGHGVTVYDRAPQMGGLLRYGIPEYRLPKEILDAELAVLEEMGIRFVNETALGPSGALTLDALRAENDAVIVAVGASRSKPLGCPGDALPGVLGGTDFLMRVALGDISQGRPISGKVVVVGGSNTAIDAARTAMRVGATHVIVAYRRTRAEMPAEPQEIAEAEAEGVVFKFLAAPMEITPDGIRLQAMTLGDPDASGRRAPVPLPGEQEWLEADMIISAIGQAVETQGLEALQATRWNTLAAHPQTFATNLPGVFAIGDATGQSAYAIEAMAHARKAAAAVHAYINEESGIAPPGLPQALPPLLLTDDTPAPPPDAAPPRQSPPLTPEQARTEASRCLSCGCTGYTTCRLIALANRLDANPKKYTNHAHPSPSPEAARHRLTHNPAKCILCGLCIRHCESRLGHSQGLLTNAHRGMKTILHTKQLNSPPCTHCTHCADICPTGAMLASIHLIIQAKSAIIFPCTYDG